VITYENQHSFLHRDISSTSKKYGDLLGITMTCVTYHWKDCSLCLGTL